MSVDEVQENLKSLPNWTMTICGKRIRRSLIVKNFAAGMDLFNRIAKMAEEENHHPDLHLTEYRKVSIEVWTHTVNGLTENDFILASKIDSLEKDFTNGQQRSIVDV